MPMKLPNGYGSVTKLSGNRRNPYMARVTLGRDDYGQITHSTVFPALPTPFVTNALPTQSVKT